LDAWQRCARAADVWSGQFNYSAAAMVPLIASERDAAHRIRGRGECIAALAERELA